MTIGVQLSNVFSLRQGGSSTGSMFPQPCCSYALHYLSALWSGLGVCLCLLLYCTYRPLCLVSHSVQGAPSLNKNLS
jgi:hypothetical protein